MIHVGTGGRGQTWVETIHACKDEFEQVALVDIDHHFLQTARERSGLPQSACFSSLSEAMTEVDAEVVIVVTPSPLHAKFCHMALDAGKHVMVEKPFTNRWQDAVDLVRKAGDQALKLVVTHNYRYTPPERVIQRLIKEEIYGKPGYMTLIHHRYRPQVRSFTMDDPMIYEMSCHHFDSILAFFGDRAPSQIAAKGFNPSWSRYPGPAAASALIELEGGIQVCYLGTFTSMDNQREYRIECSEGAIAWDEEGIRAIRPGGQEIISIPVSKAEKLPETQIAEDFYRYVTEGVEPPISGRQNLKTMQLVCGAIEASRRGQIVHFGAEWIAPVGLSCGQPRRSG